MQDDKISKNEEIKFWEETILTTLINHPNTYYNMLSYGLKEIHFNNGYTKFIFSKIAELKIYIMTMIGVALTNLIVQQILF